MSPETFFEPRGEQYLLTELARGPWSPDLAHGGPPAALLGRAMEACAKGETPLRAARVTFDLLRPVPLGLVSVSAEVVRRGKAVVLVAASLRAGDKELVRASALFIRTTPVALPPLQEPPMTLPAPEACAPRPFPFFVAKVGYHTAMETRVARGEFGAGAMAIWMRMRHPLVPGEEPSPLQRVLIAADSGNGVSFALDVTRYTFVNPDLTVHLHRLPEGEWVALDAVTRVHGDGVGLAESALDDARGPIGRGLQSLLVERRA